LVQIAAPNATGLSHNQYTQYQVDPSGLILNNSSAAVLTQQGGYISANPNLPSGVSARIILNEVTGTSASQLNGYTEVAGTRAEVIIANPNGISCNGCGFINTSRGVLTTGTPMFGGSGSLDAFHVTTGDITIGSGGLNAGNTDQLDLISRSVKVNGELWGNNLNVITGNNQVDYANLGIQVLTGDNNKPTVGIDVSQLGGMYANKIRLVGTEAGVGVNFQGAIAAQAGDINIDNQGHITLAGNTFATGNISITGAAGTSNSGTMQSQQNIHIAEQGDIINSGYIEAGNGIVLTAQKLDNVGGSIKNLGTTSDVDISMAQSINNATLHGTTSFIASNGQLKLRAVVLDNSAGTLYSKSDLTINAATLLNKQIGNQQGLVNSGKNLSLNVRNKLDNSNGQIYAKGKLNFEQAGASLDNTSGSFSSSGNLLINLASINNQGGNIAAYNDLFLTTASLSGAGSLFANRDANLTLLGDYTSATGNSLAANRDLNLSVQGNFINQADMQALCSFTVNAGNITNQTGATVNSNLTTFSTSGNIVNDGRIDGNTITTQSDNFTNTGSVIGNDVSITANNLFNRDSAAVIAATNKIDLWVANELQNTGGAEIYSLGNINIAANNVMDGSGNFTNQTLHILNESSLIEADGNINIGAVTLDNQRPAVALTTDINTVVKTLTPAPVYVLSPFVGYIATAPSASSLPTQQAFFEQDITGLNATTKSFNVTVNDPISGKPTVFYESISATPTYGYQFSVNTPTTTSQVIAQSNIASITPLKNYFTGLIYGYDVTLKDGTTQTFDTQDKVGNFYAVSYFPGYDPNVNIKPTEVITSGIMTETSRVVTTKTTDINVPLVSTLPSEARIISSGNINLNVGKALNNYVSTISAGNNLTISGVTTLPGQNVQPITQLTNTALASSRTIEASAVAQLNGSYTSGGSPMYGCTFGCTTNYVSAKQNVSFATINTAVPGSVPINSLVVAGNNLHVAVTNETNQTVTGSNNQITGATLGAAQAAPSVGGTQSGTPGVTLPTSGLYTLHPQPKQRYLVVTDTRFTSYTNFISSDYLLGRLGIDPALTQKRLGDGFYEEKLVADQILAKTGKRNLNGYSNIQSGYQALMDEALTASTDLKLIPGVELTKDQIAALRRDIVWMVAEDVKLPDGTTIRALTPKVYFSRASQMKLNNMGALIAANDISIKTGSVFDNNGAVISDTATNLIVGDLVNRGNIQSGGLLYVNATNDIRNESGLIAASRIDLNAGHDILNTTLTKTIQTGDDKFGASNTLIGRTGSITAYDSLNMKAANDIAITGATIQAGGDASLFAGGKLSMNTIVAEAKSRSANSGVFNYDAQQTTNIGSTIQTGGKLSLTGTKDVTITSATINTGSNLTIDSSGDLTINAAKNISKVDKSANVGTSLFASKKYDETVVASNISAGKNITLSATHLKKSEDEQNHDELKSNSNLDTTERMGNSQGNINIASANINSNNGKLTLIASNNINLTTTDETHSSFTQSHNESSGFLSSSSSDYRDASERTNAIGSSLKGNNIALQSGNDINITGSHVASVQDTTIAAVHDINIAAATESRSEDHYHHESSSGLNMDLQLNITTDGPNLTTKSHLDGTTQSLSRSLIESGNGNVTAVAGNNIVISGSSIAVNSQAAARPASSTDTETEKESSAVKGQINLKAGNTIALLSGVDTLNQNSSTVLKTQNHLLSDQQRTITDTASSTDSYGSSLSGTAVNLESGGDILLQGAAVKAGTGGISMDAAGDIQLLAATNSHQSSHHETLNTNGLTMSYTLINPQENRKENLKIDTTGQTATLTSLQSGGNITTHSGRDTTLEATVINAAGSVDLSAGSDTQKGNIFYKGVKESNYYSVEDKHNSDIWQSQGGKGEYKETLKLANISAGKGLNVNASGNIVIDLPSVPVAAPASTVPELDANGKAIPPPLPLTAAEQAAKQKTDFEAHIDALAKQPGQAWIGQLAKRDSVKFNQINLALQHWDYVHEGLTAEAAAVIVIVVTYFTAGAASSAAGSITGASAAGATVGAGAAMATTAIAAGITTLAGQGAVALLNNKGDLGRTLEALGKEDSIKALALAMVTAGVLQGLDAKLNLANINAQAGFGAQLTKNIINNTASATIDVAINGGNFEDKLNAALKNAFIDTGAAQGANLIGNIKVDGKLNDYTHQLAHAIAGCAAGLAKNGDCGSSALGAVVGEIAAEAYGGSRLNGTNLDIASLQTDTVNFARMMAAIAAAVTGNDVNAAAAAGGNAAENNYLNHNDAVRLSTLKSQKNIGKCDNNCELEIAKLQLLDAKNNQTLDACTGLNSSSCDAARQEVRNAAAEYIRKNDRSPSNFDLENTFQDEKSETLSLAGGTVDGKALGTAQGAATTLAEGAIALGKLIMNVSGSAFGDSQSQQDLHDGAGAAYDFVKDPNNWPQLLGAMSPQDREKLAVAYEQGDGNAVGQIMGAQMANLPVVGGGALGTIRKVEGVAGGLLAETAISGKTVLVQGKPIINKSADEIYIGFAENPLISAHADMNWRVEGQLSISIRTYANDGADVLRIDGFTGTKAYDDIFSHFGDRVTSVKNSYISDNAKSFNEFVSQGSSLEQAAMQTWDGKQMLNRGFSNVEVKVTPNVNGTSNISTIWTK
jgi:filamentous hemagglutinin family protein